MDLPYPINVHGTHGSQALTDHIIERFAHATDQHAAHVREVDVRLIDDNGPRGGVDQHVHVVIRLDHGEPIRIDRTEADAYAAVSHAADTAKNVLGRLLHRRAARH